MEFLQFRAAIENQFEIMQQYPLFKVDVSKTDLWDTYLGSFPEGTDPIYKERSYHDCQCCKQFIRIVGNVVAVVNGQFISIWSNAPECETYGPVARAMAALVEESSIDRPFFHYEKRAGTKLSHSHEDDGTVKSWDHFHVNLPAAVVMEKGAIATRISKIRSSKDVFQRSLEEITPEAIETVLDLIEEGTLYRGEEHRNTVATFQEWQSAYSAVNDRSKNLYAWKAALSGYNPSVLRIRNSAIGTLLVDLSEGKGLDRAVGAFEAMVAPSNYKRPKALITKAMIQRAQKEVEELGMQESLSRRHATPEDVTVNNVIFANRNAVKAMDGENIFTQMLSEQAINPRSLEDVEELNIEDFMETYIGQVDSIQLLVENRLEQNLFSLVAPVNAEAPNMLKWDNNFSWAYNGDLADSMKERVKAAGGKVDGILRFSIQWNDNEAHNKSDYDAHCVEPNNRRIFFQQMHSPTSGVLDVDIIQPVQGKAAVENITWSNESTMLDGEYKFLVHSYSGRNVNDGFTAEFEADGEVREYAYNQSIATGVAVEVLRGTFKRGEGFTVTQELPSSVSSKEIWSIPTMQFREVSMLMLSPNHWDDNNTGNKHYFFVLEGCNQPGNVRGFYNEFLTDKLRDHRKVFEVLGSKMKAPESDRQLSGLGFSSTKRGHVYCRVSGSLTRTLKITF